MRFASFGTTVALLVLPPAAPAAAIAPGAPAAVGTATDSAHCLRAAAPAGPLVVQAPKARRYAVDVRDLAGVTGTVRLGPQLECAAAASGPRLLVAAPVLGKRGSTLRAAFGPGAPVQALTPLLPFTTSISAVSAAVAPDGRATVAWAETRRTSPFTANPRSSTRVRLARAAPGGPLGPATTVTTANGAGTFAAEPTTALGYDAAGTLTVLTATPRRPVRDEEGTVDELERVELRTAAGDAPLGAPVTLDARRQGPTDPRLSVAADGSALIAAASSFSVTAWARPAGGGPVRRVLEVTPSFPEDAPAPPPADGAKVVTIKGEPRAPAVAAGPGGSGAIAWRDRDGRTDVLTLPPGGPLGAPVTVLPAAAQATDGGGIFGFLSATSGAAFVLAEPEDAAPSLVLTEDGRVALATTRQGGAGGPATAFAALGTLAGGLAPAERLSSPARSAARAVAVLDAAGAPAVVVADENGDLVDSTKHPAGRITVAPAGATPGVQAPAPAATLLGPLSATVRGSRPFPVRVRCAAACDVRVESVGGRDPFGGLVAGESLGRAGVATVRLTDQGENGKAARRRLRLRVTVAAPGSLAGRTLRGTFALRRLALTPAPRITAIRVRRGRTTATVTFTAPTGLRGYQVSAFAFPVSETTLPTRYRALGGRRYRATVKITSTSKRIILSGASRDAGDAPLNRSIPLPKR